MLAFIIMYPKLYFSLFLSLYIYIVRVSVLLYQRMFMSGLAVRQLERTADIPGDWYTCKI